VAYKRNKRFPVPPPKLVGRPYESYAEELQEFCRRVSGELINVDSDVSVIATLVPAPSNPITGTGGETPEEDEILAFLRL
jgi:hypothetical protein